MILFVGLHSCLLSSWRSSSVSSLSIFIMKQLFCQDFRHSMVAIMWVLFFILLGLLRWLSLVCCTNLACLECTWSWYIMLSVSLFFDIGSSWALERKIKECDFPRTWPRVKKYGNFIPAHTLNDCPLSDTRTSKYANLSTPVQKLT